MITLIFFSLGLSMDFEICTQSRERKTYGQDDEGNGKLN
jgi:uncharacterized membrane protein YdfJ with MMPL/SSD domain